MTDTAFGTPNRDYRKLSSKALQGSAKFWFIVLAAGQWLFVAYIIGFYGVLLLNGGAEALSETHLPGGYVAGDTIGNSAVIAHVMLAALIIAGGPLQLIPAIRARFPTFHRWNGRTFMLAGSIASIAGIYMTWFRDGGSVIGDVYTKTGTTISGFLVLIFAVLALRTAMSRDFKSHRKWALRLFLAVGTVWFARVMMFGWIFATGGVGIDFKTYTGPMLTALHYAQWVLPLLMLEFYFWAQEKAKTRGRFVAAGTLSILTVGMAFGIFAVTIANWYPRM